MATKLNLHKLIGTDAGYLHAIRVEREDRDDLSEAREEIRTELRDAFRNWEKFVNRAELRDSAFEGTAYTPDLPAPKFRIQGSFAYHTANDCQNPPDQQIDQDDGVFLPLSFVMVKGFARPTIASSAYFQLVERALRRQRSQVRILSGAPYRRTPSRNIGLHRCAAIQSWTMSAACCASSGCPK